MEIAVAGIEGPIKVILNKIGKEIGDEASLIFNFPADFDDLRRRLEFLELYLEDASDKILQAPESKLLQRWITELRNTVMDAEDLVEICSLPLENDDLDDHENQGKGISSCIFCVPFSWLRKIVRQSVLRHKLGKQIKEFNNRLNHLEKQANEYGIQKSIPKNENVTNDEVIELLELEFLDDESTSVDIEPKKNEILSLIGQYRVVAVVGMGGSGKTRLLKHVFKSLKSSSRYETCIWLCLSQKFTIERLQRHVLATLNIHDPGDPPTILANKIHEKLKDQNYVVVFDDTWALSQTQINRCQNVWEKLRKIGLPEHSDSRLPEHSDSRILDSRILVSTRDRVVARQLGAEIYDMQLLSPEKSRELLLKHLPSHSKAPMTAEKLESFDAVLRRCGGLPLAIVAAAGALKFKNVDEWDSILQQMDTSSSDDPQVVTVNAFRLSYNALNYRAKRCFEFLGVLAEDEGIWAERLVAMWKAERLVENRKQGMSILMHLWHRSLLQFRYGDEEPLVTVHDEDSLVRMHDVVHDLAVDIAQQSGGVSGGVFEIEALKDALLDKQRICRRISLTNEREVPLAPAVTSVSCPRSARTLRLTADGSLTEIPSQFLANACNLRVLDLSYNRLIERLPINCLKNMRLLKFLDITGTYINQLPECVRHLTSLEFLGTTIQGDVPVWIEELQCLDTFTGGSLGADWNNATVVPMPRLRKLENIRIKIKSGGKNSSNSSRGNSDTNKQELWSWDSFCSQLRQLEHLVLHVEEFEDGKTPPCSVWHLSLIADTRGGGTIMSMPDEWFQQLNNLSVLYLEGINFPSAPPPQYVGLSPLRFLKLEDCDEYSGTISHLPRLKTLELQDSLRCKNLPEEFGSGEAFPSLITLKISGLDELRTLPKLETGAMPRLSYFGLYHCKKLEKADGWKEKLRTLPETGRCVIGGIKDDLMKELEGDNT